MSTRTYSFLRITLFALLIIMLALSVFQPQATASAAAVLTISPITWNVIGLDSNNVSVGPNNFPVGARVCNTGNVAATNVTSTFVWDSVDPYISLRSGSLTMISVASLAAGACTDFYFEVTVTRNASAYNHTSRYHITATADTLGLVSTPAPRELFVEHLVSQSRNTISDVQYGSSLASLASVANGGTMALVVGNTYYIKLVGATATNGYEQIESFINFPNTVFQILSVSTTYTADTSPYLSSPNDRLYGDACLWENDPNSPNYRACNGVGKAGGGTTVTYQVKILSVGSTNPQPLSTLIYDFSGSSFHYNADYGVSTRYAYILDPSAVTISKNFSPDPTTAGGVSTLTFTLTNPTPVAFSGLNFTDTLPATPGAMAVAGTPGATTTGCGSPTFALAAGATSLSFSNGSLAANSSCTIQVNVTAPVTGTYTNTSGHLFINALDTGNFATDTLTVNSAPAGPAPVCGLTMAQWTFAGFTTNPPPFPAANTQAADVTTAAISNGNGLTSEADTTATGGNPQPGIRNYGWQKNGPIDTNTSAFIQFAIDTSKYTQVNMQFDAQRKSNGPSNDELYYSTNGTTWTLKSTFSSTTSWATYGAYNFTGQTNTTGITYFRIYGYGANATSSGNDMNLDNITFTGCGTPVPPTISKAFLPNPVAIGATSTLTFTVTNPNTGVAFTGVSFTDTLPSGLTVATGSSSQCGGTLSTTAPRTISFSGGTLAVSTSCPLNVTVTATASGIYDNVSGFVSSTEGGTNTGTTGIAAASLTVLKPPSLSKLFAPNPILAGGISTLTFTITNPNLNNSLSSVQFLDALPSSPAQMQVAATPNAITSGCGSPTFAPAANATSLSFTNGTIAAGGTCTVSVNITAPGTGSYVNTSGAVQATISGTTTVGNPATDTLTVNPPHPAIGLLKQIATSATGPWTSFLAVTAGTDVYYQFTIENAGDVVLSPVGVTDPLVSTTSCSWPASLSVAVAGNNNHIATCVVGPVTTTAGAHPNTATASGTYSSTAYTDTSSATYATTGLTLTKSVTEASFTNVGDLLHYSYLVTNSGSASLLGPVTVTDNKATVTCPAVSSVGDLDAYLDAGESLTCTATYPVTAADFTATVVTNTASAAISGVTSNSASITVYRSLSDLTVTKTNDANSSLMLGNSFNWTLTVNNLGLAPATFADTNVILSDILPGAAVDYPQGALIVTNGATPPTGAINCSITGIVLSCDANGVAILPVGSSFTIVFPVTPTSAGSLANTVTVDPNDNLLEINEGNNTSSNTVTVVVPPSINKSFAASAIALNGSTTLTFTITNPPVNAVALTGVGFVDTYPSGLQNAIVPNASTTCAGGTITAAANGSSISLSGATIAFNNICTVTVTVTGTTTGTKTNSVTVSSLNGGAGNSATSKLTVVNAVKTVVATSEDSSSETGAPRTVLIGEIVRYHLVMDLPEGTTSSLQVVEGIVANMAYMNDGTTRIAFVCNSGAACVSSSTGAIGSNPVISGNSSNVTPVVVLPAGSISGGSGNPYGDAVDPIFSLGNVTNNDNDSDAEYVVIEFNSLVRNTSINQDGSTRGNTFTVSSNGASLTTSTDTANSRINVIEPVISTIAKSITASPLDAGDAMTYQLLITNTGNAPAFDIILTDPLSPALTTPVTVTGSTTGGSCGSTASNVSGSYSAPTATATVTCLAAGGTATININAVVANSASISSTINNSASLTYTSLPGTGTPSNPTGSTTPGTSSAISERNGSGGVGTTNDYVATSNLVSTTLTSSPAISKQFTNTSALHTSGSDVAIGEEITYDLLLTFPEGTTSADTVLDDLPTGLAVVSGTPQLITTAAASSGLLNADFNGTISTQTITPVAGDGGSVTFNFTNVVVAGDNDLANNSILLEFRARVSNVLGNQAGVILSNAATNQVGAGTPITSNTVNVTVVEPSITFGKTIIALPNPAGIGGVVQYRISYVNATGATVSTATDVHITDVLPTQLSLNLPVTVTLGGGAAGITDSSSGNNLDITLDAVPAGGSVTVDYTATIQSGISIGQSISNTANSTWSSLSGIVSGERTGSDGPAGTLNDYSATSTQAFTINSPDFNIVKTDGAATYTPGTSLTYTITVHNNGSAAGTGILTDNFTAALTNISWTCSGTGGATCSASGNGNINDSLSIPAGQSVTYSINAAVLSSSTGNLVNSATAALSAVTDPTPLNNSSTDTDTPAYSADLEITKTDGITNINAGGSAIYTIVVTNLGPSDADNTLFTDPAVAGLNVTSVTCGTANGGAVCPTVGNTTVTLMQGAGIAIPTLPSGGSVTFTVDAGVAAASGALTNTATVSPPAGVNDPGQFSNTATDTDNVVEIIAVNDAGSVVNGVAGGGSLANVLTNDTLNGSPATLANVTLTQISSTSPGVTLDVTAGAVNVAAGTSVGNYVVIYQICDQANPTICDTATVSVPVVEIDAVNDPGSAVNGAVGGQALTDVLTNDTLNGNPATLANINLTQVSTTNPGVTLDVTTGAVDVAAGTPAGNYTVTYQICDQANPSICDTATVTLPVNAPPIVAVDDSASGVNGVTGATAVLNVFNNDTLNGVLVAPGDVTLTETVPDSSGALTLNPNGTVDVAPGTASGTYQLTYSICEVLNPTNCDTAVVRVTVLAPAPPVARDDSGTTPFNTPVTLANITANDSAFGAGNSIFINTLDLDPSTSGQQTSFTDFSGNQWNMDTTTGDVLFTPAANFTGVATIPYSVQDSFGQTATANLSVTVGPPASISGTVFNDSDLNGTQGAGETGIGAVRVDLYDSSGTTLMATLTTTTGGSYSFTNLMAGDYMVVEMDLSGYVSTTPNSVSATVSAGGSAAVNFGDYRLPNSTLSGVLGMVFNDANGNGIQDSGETALSGVTLELRNNVGTVIATTTTSALGSYSFPNLAAGLYTITETDPAGFISTTLNNVTVNLSAGTTAIVNFGDQTGGAAQIADPAVTKYGSPTSATVGSPVVYTLTVGNNGNVNATNVVLTDTKPAFLDIISITISPNPGLTPVISGNSFTINFGTVTPTDSYIVTVVTRVNSLGQAPGGSNNASITSDSTTDRTFNNAASAALQITSATSGGGTVRSVRALPETGFAPGVVTDLSHTPHEAYLSTGDVTLEIPALGIKIPVVGVPLKDGAWNVAWLGNQAGWLQGTAFPSWSGNSLLTSHVYLANGLAGPFVNLNKLKFGDKVIVHAYGQKYTFEVQTNAILEPNDTSAFKHEEKPWLTLVTCKEYDEKSQAYRKRVVVQAVLVSVVAE
jgi:LPXTG-site transpeptidase (sortase) family protein